MDTTHHTLTEMREMIRAMGEHDPENMAAFHTLLITLGKEGTLDKKTKQLIAVALAVSSHCNWCIAYHVREALAAGATDGEVMQAAWMAVLMGGAPSLMYAGVAMDALEGLRGGHDRWRGYP
ncbi:MAG: carboxymuconolactone decarboxylase family protein [Methanomicrobiaceae archaeon]|nr:carboxymuconolactone decarboxylase family protein [Methanomicrobiaceae archaeon]